MRRRDFISLVGGSAVASPLGASAQQPAMPVIGFLHHASPNQFAILSVAFRQGLKEAGFVDGQNVAIEYRWAEDHRDRLPALAADLVRRRVAVIVVNTPSMAAAKAATATIPIVFVSADDPIAAGLVASFNRPGGNATGVNLFLAELSAKKLGLLHDLLPEATIVAAILNPNGQTAEVQSIDLQAAAGALGLQIQIANAGNEKEIDATLTKFSEQRVGALIVGSDPAYMAQREQIIALTKRYAIPTLYELREFVDAGGLMSYGTSIRDGYRLAGIYVGRILKGEKPADLPVVQATKFELVINLRTAKTLGIKISDNLLSLADEVIE